MKTLLIALVALLVIGCGDTPDPLKNMDNRRKVQSKAATEE